MSISNKRWIRSLCLDILLWILALLIRFHEVQVLPADNFTSAQTHNDSFFLCIATSLLQLDTHSCKVVVSVCNFPVWFSKFTFAGDFHLASQQHLHGQTKSTTGRVEFRCTIVNIFAGSTLLSTFNSGFTGYFVSLELKTAAWNWMYQYITLTLINRMFMTWLNMSEYWIMETLITRLSFKKISTQRGEVFA